MEWIKILITIAGVMVTIVLAWGKFDKRLCVFEVILKEMKENHLSHIEASMKEISKSVQEHGKILAVHTKKFNKK